MRVIGALTEYLKTCMPGETVLVTPTAGEGRRLLRAAAETGCLIMGVRAETPLTLAQEICAEFLSREGAPRLMDFREVRDLMFRTLRAMPAEGFFAGEHGRDRKTAELMAGLIAGLDGEGVDPVGGNARLDAVQRLREAYGAAKRAEGLLDTRDLLRMAAEQAPAFCAERRPNFVTLSTCRFSEAERALLTAAAGGELRTVPTEVPELITPPADCVGGHGPARPIDPARLRFASCRGIETEERFILRDILARHRRAEDCAVVYLSPEYARGLAAEAAFLGIPLTISGGVPMTGTLLYRALDILNDWKANEFDAEILRALILNGDFALSDSAAFARRLRSLNIGWGEDRYLDRFLTAMPDSEGKNPPDADTLADWGEFLRLAFRIAKHEGAPAEQKADLAEFLHTRIHISGQDDGAVRSAALRLLNSVGWLDEDETVLGRLLERMEQTSCCARQEESGALFAVPLSEAFCTGRKTLYICGMSRFCLQGSRQESPLMLDEEKKRYGLPDLTDRERENRFALELLLVQHEGETIVSYCGFDTERMIDLNPAPLFRQLSEGRSVEQVSYIPRHPLTLGDRLSRGDRVRPAEEPADPPKEDTAPAELKPAESYADRFASLGFSATSLEDALKCPLKFYLSKVLGLNPPRLPERSGGAWLNDLEMGSLCHAVLERYYAEKTGKPDWAALLDEETEKLKQERPAVRQAVMDADKKRAGDMIRRAIEWTDAAGRRVDSTEQRFGRQSGKDELPLPIRVGGRTIGLSGSIDRVDRRPEGGPFAILDYKTGSAKYYRDHLDLKLQPYLYTLALKELERRKHPEDPDFTAEVADAGYLFLKDRAEYLPVPQTDKEQAAKERLLTDLLTFLGAEENALTAMPAFSAEGGCLTMGDPDDRSEQLKDCPGRCDFAGLCPARAQIEAARLEAERKEGEQA